VPFLVTAERVLSADRAGEGNERREDALGRGVVPREPVLDVLEDGVAETCEQDQRVDEPLRDGPPRRCAEVHEHGPAAVGRQRVNGETEERDENEKKIRRHGRVPSRSEERVLMRAVRRSAEVSETGW
jgi:hypothetical protein